MFVYTHDGTMAMILSIEDVNGGTKKVSNGKVVDATLTYPKSIQ